MADVEVFHAIGADLTADPATWVFTDSTAKIREKQKVTIERGRRARVGQVQATRVSATAENADGRFARHNPLGVNFGLLKKHTPQRVDIDGVTRATTFLTGTPPKWDPSEQDQTVTLQSVGILDLLSRGRDLGSAMRRTMGGISSDDQRPIMYYPMEDGSNATQFASAVVGRPPVTIPDQIRPGADSSLAGSSALPSWDVPATLSMPVPGYSSSQWVAMWTINIPSQPVTDRYAAQMYSTGGTVARWAVLVEPSGTDEIALRGYDAGGTQVTAAVISLASGDLATTADFYGHNFLLIASAEQDGANIVCRLTLVREDGLTTAVDTGSIAGTVGVMTGDWYLYSGVDATIQGHAVLYVDPALDIAALYADPAACDQARALSGFSGEQAHERLIRLCREEGIRLQVTGSTSALMGPQLPASVLANARACEDVDLGVLAESMDWGLSYLCLAERYNVATPAIQLDYAAGEIAPPWEPTDDDQQFFNKVVATRPSGSSVIAADQASIDDVGEYGTTTRPQVYTDGQLTDHAGFSLRLGLCDELTWPNVKPNILAAPALLADWLTTTTGSEMWVVGHPAPLAPDTIKQVIEGSTETYGEISVDISVILSPASPYTIAVVEDDDLGRADTDGMVITAAIDDDDLSCLLATTTATSTLATTDGAQFPVDLRLTPDLRMLGEVITVNDIDAPAAITYVAAGTVNHANNASVTPGLPAGRAVGDLLLTLVAIRNSGTGVPVVPSGQTLMLDLGNVMLLGRIATATAADQPTITFSDGVAGADTSAQQAAFRGAFSDPSEVLVVHNSLLNASAQDIAYPALNVRLANNLIIYLAWKQDDWTSVTSPGTEIGEPDTTTGNDQGIVWAYSIQTTATDIAAGSFVVTGGASAISRGAVVAIRANVQLATISARAVNDVSRSWPARTLVALATPAIPGY